MFCIRANYIYNT